MTDQSAPKAIIFLDFDGTITRRDAVDAILESYAKPEWLELESEWRAGRLGSRDCLEAQMDLVIANHSQLDSLLDRIEVDESLSDLLEWRQLHQIPLHIISDGFDYCIQRILSRVDKRTESLLHGVRICASRLEARGNRWHTSFPFFPQTCAHGCATCKPAAMRLLNPTNAPAIFVGDGLSDQYAVESADLVFAKSGLAAYCDEQSIPHISYSDLGEVARYLNSWLEARMFRDGEDDISERVSA